MNLLTLLHIKRDCWVIRTRKKQWFEPTKYLEPDGSWSEDINDAKKHYTRPSTPNIWERVEKIKN